MQQIKLTRKIVLIALVMILSVNTFSMKIVYIYDIEKIKEIFKKDKIIINNNGLQIVGYNWGITLVDLDDEIPLEDKKIEICSKMVNDDNKYLETVDGIDIYLKKGIIQYVKIDKIILIAYCREKSRKSMDENLKK